jgi:hypothetical protein
VNGRIVFENGRFVCTLENREKVDEQIVEFTDFQSYVSEVTVEKSGHVRAVVKITICLNF